MSKIVGIAFVEIFFVGIVFAESFGVTFSTITFTFTFT